MNAEKDVLLNFMPHGADTASSLPPSGTVLERSTRITKALSSQRWTVLPTSLRRSRSKDSPQLNCSRREPMKLLTITETVQRRVSPNFWKRELPRPKLRMNCKASFDIFLILGGFGRPYLK